MTKTESLHRALRYWHKEIRTYGRRGDRFGVGRSLVAVHRLETRLGLPLSYI